MNPQVHVEIKIIRNNFKFVFMLECWVYKKLPELNKSTQTKINNAQIRRAYMELHNVLMIFVLA